MYKLVLKGNTYPYRRKLKRLGYAYNHDKNRYEKEFASYPSKKDIGRIYYFPGVKHEVIDTSQSRSADYRKRFFDSYKRTKRIKGKDYYRCVYCGRLLRREKIQVDHLYPVKMAETNYHVRDKLKKQGCLSVNDPKNLVPACGYCNKRKGAKMGWWIIQGKLGKSESYWRIRRIILASATVIALYMLLTVFST